MRFKQRKGQSLVLIALGLVVLLGFVAFAVDFGVDYSARQKMRNNTDAAALAGAQSLTDAAAAKTAAANYYASNMGLTAAHVTVLGTNGNTTRYSIGGDTVDITSPYSDSITQAKGIAASNAVRVYACRNVRHHFGSLFGLPSNQSCVRSVAILSGGGGFAMWADSEVEIEGNNNVITGNTHANRNLEVVGNNNSISGTAFYVTSAKIKGNNNRVVAHQTTAKTKPSVPNTLAYYKSLAQANGTYYAGNKVFAGNNLVLNGVIFVEGGNLYLRGSNLSGTVTFVTSGGSIQFLGNNLNFTAHVDKLLAYAGGSAGSECDPLEIELVGRDVDLGDRDFPPHGSLRVIRRVRLSSGIKVTGNNASFRGTLYSTHGEVAIAGNNFNLTGALIGGEETEIKGNNARVTFNSTYGLGGSSGSSLLE